MKGEKFEMGYMRHRAVIVTGWQIFEMEQLRGDARRIFGSRGISGLLISETNGFYTFMVGPDGSKMGWPEAAKAEAHRAEFVALLHELQASGKTFLAWVEVQYGDDDLETRVVGDSDAWERARREVS